MRIRLASYNIHKCQGLDRRRDPGRTIAVLNQLGADIIALQEVDLRMGARKAALTSALIHRETDFLVAPFSLEGPSLGWHGQTILVRKGLDVSATRRLELPGLEPRGAVLAEICGPKGAIRIVGVHLGLLRRYRQRQLAAIRAALTRHDPMPTAIIGDFNDWSADGGAAALLPEFRLHVPGRSFPALQPVAALDRVAIGYGIHLRDAGVFRARPARLASDHLPIWADLEVAAAQGAAES